MYVRGQWGVMVGVGGGLSVLWLTFKPPLSHCLSNEARSTFDMIMALLSASAVYSNPD